MNTALDALSAGVRFLEPLAYPPGFVWLVLTITTLLALKKKQLTLAVILGATSAVLWVLGSSPASAMLLASLERPYVRSSPEVPTADAIVYLGSGLMPSPNDTFGIGLNSATERVVTAAELARKKRAPNLVLCGAIFHSQSTEGALVERWLKSWELDLPQVLVMPGSSDTRQEAERVVAAARDRQWRKIILVTSASHMKRSTAIFKKVGFEVIPYACDFAGMTHLEHEPRWRAIPRMSELQLFTFYFHEILGWYFYRLRGWV